MEMTGMEMKLMEVSLYSGNRLETFSFQNVIKTHLTSIYHIYCVVLSTFGPVLHTDP